MASDVKWFKFMNGMFEDEKIEYIESLPDGESVIIIWVKLLCLASKSNSDGSLMIANEIPYTTELLAHKFKKTAVQIQYAVGIMQKLGMIDVIDNIIYISNWNKYQSVDALDKIREQTRLRVAKHRENKKMIACNVTCNDNVTLKCNENALISNSISISNNINNKSKKDILNDNAIIVLNYLNEKVGTKFKPIECNLKFITARLKDYSIDDLKAIIDKKYKDWFGTEMQQYLRPKTLFNQTNCENYTNSLGEVKSTPIQSHVEYNQQTSQKEIDDFLEKLREKEKQMGE